jgi:hypothetical protein
MKQGEDLRPSEGDLVLVYCEPTWQVHVLGSAPALSWPRYEDALTSLQRYARTRAVDVWTSESDGAFERVIRYRRPDRERRLKQA